jgi:fibronectin type 3 domain-containing protein
MSKSSPSRSVRISALAALIVAGIGLSGCDIVNQILGLDSIEVPAGLQASYDVYDGYVRLSWSPAKGAGNYNVYRGPTQTGPWSLIGNGGATFYNDSTAAAGVEYWYRVAATDAYGDNESEKSAAQVGRCRGAQQAVLSAPTGLTATQGDPSEYIRLSWDTVSGAEGYNIYYDNDGTWTFWDSTTNTYYDDSVTTAGYHYSYRITAFAGTVESAPSASIAAWRIAPLTIPANVVASQGTAATYVALTWDSVPNAAGYNIYWWNGTAWKYMATTTYTFYYDSDTVAGTHYLYSISAYYGSVETDGSLGVEGWRVTP